MLIYITENMNQNYSKIPCFVEMKSKQQRKFVVHQNKIYGFSITIPFIFFQNCVSKNSPFFPKFSPFMQSQVTSPWFTNNKNSKFKLTMLLEQSLSWMPWSSKLCNHPTLLTLIKVEFFEKHSKWRCKMLESCCLFT